MLPKKPRKFFNTLKEFCTFTVNIDQKFVFVQLKMQGYIKEENGRIVYPCFNENLKLSDITYFDSEMYDDLNSKKRKAEYELNKKSKKIVPNNWYSIE